MHWRRFLYHDSSKVAWSKHCKLMAAGCSFDLDAGNRGEWFQDPVIGVTLQFVEKVGRCRMHGNAPGISS